jgi:hypothetical protein
MKKRYYFLAAMMLWMFSSVSFASITESIVNPGPVSFSLSFTQGGTTIASSGSGFDQQGALKIADDWFHLVFGHFGHGGFGDDFGHEHHGHHGHHEPDGDEGGPAAVPLPSAVWLFGSALSGLIGLVTRRQAKGIMA